MQRNLMIKQNQITRRRHENKGNRYILEMADVGWLIQEVAGLLEGILHVQRDAEYTLQQDALIKAKQAQTH